MGHLRTDGSALPLEEQARIEEVARRVGRVLGWSDQRISDLRLRLIRNQTLLTLEYGDVVAQEHLRETFHNTFPTALRQTTEGTRLRRAPGYGLLWFADFFYSRQSLEECLQPTIQDLQDEYAEALAAKRPHKAAWVRIRGTWSFVCAAGMLTMASAGKQVVKIWKAVG
jgi:hypothetical protein